MLPAGARRRLVLSHGRDGKTINVTDNDVVHHQITTYTLDKQE